MSVMPGINADGTVSSTPMHMQPPQGKRLCPTCRGTGINPVIATHICPKCHGERFIAPPHSWGRRP